MAGSIRRAKVDGPKDSKWTVQKTQSGQSKRLKVDGLRKWTVLTKGLYDLKK